MVKIFLMYKPSSKEQYTDSVVESIVQIEGLSLEVYEGFTPPDTCHGRRIELLKAIIPTCEYVTWVDPDDIIVPGVYADMADYVNQHGVGMIHVKEQMTLDNGFMKDQYCCRAIISTRVLRKVLDSNITIVSDAHLVSECKRRTSCIEWSEVGYIYQPREGSLSLPTKI